MPGCLRWQRDAGNQPADPCPRHRGPPARRPVRMASFNSRVVRLCTPGWRPPVLPRPGWKWLELDGRSSMATSLVARRAGQQRRPGRGCWVRTLTTCPTEVKIQPLGTTEFARCRTRAASRCQNSCSTCTINTAHAGDDPNRDTSSSPLLIAAPPRHNEAGSVAAATPAVPTISNLLPHNDCALIVEADQMQGVLSRIDANGVCDWLSYGTWRCAARASKPPN